MLTLQYNQTGDRRPAFAKAVGEILGVKPKYTSVPKFAYIIDFVTVTRQGNIEVDEDISATVTCQGNIEVDEDISATVTRQGDIEVDEGPDKIESLIQKLMERGYSPLPSAPAQAITELQPVSMESANATIQSTSAAIPPAEQAQDCFSEGPAANSIQSTSATIQSAEQTQGCFSEEPAANNIQSAIVSISFVEHAQSCLSEVPAVIPAEQVQGCETNTAPEHPTDVEQNPQPFSDKDNSSTSEGIGVTTISVPRDIFTDLALSNLQKLIWAKGELICQALDIASTDIEVTDETVNFPWFGELDAEEVKYISQFINGLCEFANLSKRITSKRRKEGNPKFAMRTWVIRLGFKGPEYKGLRAYLLKRLPGDAAWRYGRPDSVARASING